MCLLVQPLRLDQYALQALRPEVQKEKYTNFLLKRKLVKEKYTWTQALRPESTFTHISGLTAWDVYAFRALRPEMQKEK